MSAARKPARKITGCLLKSTREPLSPNARREIFVELLMQAILSLVFASDLQRDPSNLANLARYVIVPEAWVTGRRTIKNPP
jgi:hypothetical protein